MELELPTAGLEHYKSASQRVRIATEAWAETNLYCPNCDSDKLVPFAANTPAIDYVCSRCESPFQLKSQSRRFSRRITDAAYNQMRGAIKENRTPNLFVLHYEREEWTVRNLILIPRFAFSFSLLERRNPLGPKARRAGWIGCNILLGNIPPDAKIGVVLEGVAASTAVVRHKYAQLRPLGELKHEERGWTLDVLNIVRSLKKLEFSLSEVYGFQAVLARLHPANRHVKDKIRQQLQVLRDLGLVEFLGGGNYRLG